MSGDVARRAHAILKRAIDADAELRAAIIDSECGEDRELRARVTSLLGAIRASERFLEIPAVSGTPDSRAAVPVEIPGYRIVRLIAQGGMARVYEAIQERPHRQVALKVMNRGLTESSALQRFMFETEVLARLRHPNIAQIYETGSFGDGAGSSMPYFAMEYVAGARTITQYADDHGLGLEERLRLCAAVCDAVQHGHQNGVIHRDLKPGNVLVDAAGHVKVIDFGIARSTDPSRARITEHVDVGRLVGTLNYMSPEQCAGAMDLDARTDVYSLGVMLYELACGQLPHDLSRVPVPEALRVVQRESPPRPGSVRPALRGDLETVILKAMEKDPARRYPTAAALAADIGHFLRREAIDARPPTLLYHAKLLARRHRTSVVALVALATSLIAGIVLTSWFALRARSELTLRRAAEDEAIVQRDSALWQAYVASIFAANSAIRSDELQAARRNLSAAPEVHRNWEWRVLHESAERCAEAIPAHEDMVYSFDRSRDGTRLVTGARDGSIRVWDAGSRALLSEFDGIDQFVMALAFDHDGRRVASGSSDRTVRVWDVATGKELRLLGRHPQSVGSVSFGAGDVLASAGTGGTAYLWDASSGEKIGPIDGQPGGVSGVAFTKDGGTLVTWNARGSLWVRSADGKEILHDLTFPGEIYCAAISDDDELVAAGGSRGQIEVWNLRTGAPLHSLQTDGSVSTIRSLAFSRDGAWLASGQTDRIIRLWSMHTGEEQPERLSGHEETVSGLSFSPDGTQLVSVSWDRSMRVWDRSGPDRVEPVTTLRGHSDRVISCRFSPDGGMLASSSNDGTIRLWDPETGKEIGALRGHTAPVYALAISPDGRTIASGSHDRTVRLWKAATGECMSVLRGHPGQLWSVAFSPDGRTLASAGNDGVIRLWDLESGEARATLEGHENRVTCVRFSPDGSLLASASRDRSVRVWDVARASERFRLDGHSLDVYSVVFSADGTRLYSGSRDQSVRIWDTTTGECLHILEGHGQIVTSLALNPKGDRLAAGSWYGEIVLWDVPTLDVVLSLQAHGEAIRGVEFSPDGRWLASSSYDGTVRLFDDAPRAERVRRRHDAAARYDDVAPIVERALKAGAERATEAIEDPSTCSAALVPWARKELLRRSLVATPPSIEPDPQLSGARGATGD